MVGKTKSFNSSREIMVKDKESNKTYQTLFFICLLILLCLISSPAWANERDTLIQKARQTSWDGRYDEAVAIYRQLVKKNPKDVEAMLGLATVLSWQKKFREAAEVYRKVKDIRPDIPDGEIGLLRLKAWQGGHAEAETGLKVLLAKYPKRFDILFLLGQVTAWQKKFNESVGYYKALLELYPDNMEATKGLANTYKWMKNTKEGVKVYAKILDKDPNNIDALMGTGILYSQAGDNKKAIEYLEKAKEKDPDRADVRAMLGTLYSYNAQLDDAVTELQKSVALERGNIGNYIVLGRIYRWQQKIEESIKLYKKALELDPQNTEAMVGLGRVYVNNDQWDEAEELYLKALAIDPNNLDAKEALKQLKRIQAPEANIRYNFLESRLHDLRTSQIGNTFIDHRGTLESFFKLSPKSIFQIRYQHAQSKQLGLSNTTTNFNVNTDTASLGLNQKLPSNFNMRFRLDLSRFSNNDTANNTANLLESENDFAGYFILSKEFRRQLLQFTLGRELFVDSNFGLTPFSTVENINTYSISYDAGITDYFTTLVLLSLNENSTFQKLKQDHAFRARYRLPKYKKLEFEYQFRYLSNPDTYRNTLGINFQNQISRNFRYEARYAFTASDSNFAFEDFLRHSGKLFVSWEINPWLAWSTDAIASIDRLNGDNDYILNLQTYLTIRF
jgi:tetratricopeptide (TPR) repeat protein